MFPGKATPFPSSLYPVSAGAACMPERLHWVNFKKMLCLSLDNFEWLQQSCGPSSRGQITWPFQGLSYYSTWDFLFTKKITPSPPLLHPPPTPKMGGGDSASANIFGSTDQFDNFNQKTCKECYSFFLSLDISLSCQTLGRSWEWMWDIPIISWCSCWWRQYRASVIWMRSRSPVLQQRLSVRIQWSNLLNPILLSRALLPALSCVQTCLLHLLDISWEVDDLPLFLKIKLPELLLSMAQDNISVHDVAIR